MKIYVLIFLAIAAVALALPVEDKDGIPLLANEGESLNVAHHRVRRVTCDLLNKGHSVCAIHCYTKLRKGGWCDKRGVCNCRKDKWFG